MAKRKTTVDEVRKALGRKKQERPAAACLSTGSTLLNLALTGEPDQGFVPGKYYLIVGDSSAGKTFLSLTCLAEASINSRFKDYRLIHDDVEGGALMNFERYFGKAAADRIEPPDRADDGTPLSSENAEDFFYNLHDAMKEKPCIYVLDSMDSLSSDYELKRFEQNKAATRKGGEAKGDVADGKAKANSKGLRTVLNRLSSTNSILLIINQTRDNPNAGMFESKKTRSGGKALTFYATGEIWLSIGKRLTKEVKGKKRVIGIVAQLRIKKNRSTGKERTVSVPIYYSSGIDDVGSCVDYLIEEGAWKKRSGSQRSTGGIDASSLREGLSGTKEKIIRTIEEEGLEQKLRQLVKKTWDEIEAACAVQRKPRY